jgi:hypothetical protein
VLPGSRPLRGGRHLPDDPIHSVAPRRADMRNASWRSDTIGAGHAETSNRGRVLSGARGDDDWLPDFRKTNPFSSELSVPVWHWKSGFVYN